MEASASVLLCSLLVLSIRRCYLKLHGSFCFSAHMFFTGFKYWKMLPEAYCSVCARSVRMMKVPT